MRKPMNKSVQTAMGCLVALAGLAGASAQTPVGMPVPFATSIAGVPSGGSTTACGTTIPTAAASSGAAVFSTTLGDGCLATQATMSAAYGSFVDSYGNVYFGDYNDYELRVLYMGGTALAAVIQAVNPTQTITPQVGHVYALAGSRTAALSQTTSSGGKKAYYCDGAGGAVSPAVAIASNGDECPATYAYIKPRSPYVDAYGNIFFTSPSGSGPVRMIYVGGGPNLTKLMSNLYPNTTPQVGYIYSIIKSSTNGYAGDGTLADGGTVEVYQERDVAVDSNGNVYMSDGNSAANSTSSPINNASDNTIRVVNAQTGLISTYAGGVGCTYPNTSGCPEASAGDGGPATAATFGSPYSMFFDKNNNLYICDYWGGKLRVIYQGGSVPGLGSNLTPGYIYTVAGGGTSTTSGVPATQVNLGTTSTTAGITTGGIDGNGNLYVEDTTHHIWRIDANTGIAVIIAGGGGATIKGNKCSGTTGPVATDSIGDGCPATQIDFSSPGQGRLALDRFGNIYETDSTEIRELSYDTTFTPTGVGKSTTQYVGFTAVQATTLSAETFNVEGAAGAGIFSDAGGTNDTCALNASLTAGQICSFAINFAPTSAGPVSGSLQFTLGTTALPYSVGGDGVGANTSVDSATVTSIGTYTPTGVATDVNGNVYIADSASKTVVKAPVAGGTATTLISALGKPAQVAVDGAGNVYVADAGNNRVSKVSAAGGTATSLGTGLNAPQGVVVDYSGDVYIADTGNNRIVELTPGGAQIVLNANALATALAGPTALALDGAGDLYVVDSGNSRVVEFPYNAEPQVVNLGTTAITPEGLAVDAAGDLYVADLASQSVVEFAPGSVNGNSLLYSGELVSPKGIAVDQNGSFYVADSGLTGLLAANRAKPTFQFPNTNLNTTNSTTFSVTNTGNAGLSFNGAQFTTATGNTAVFSVGAAASNGCVLATAMSPGASCQLTATFTPTGPSLTIYTENVSFVTNAANVASSGAVLTGEGVKLQPTTLTITGTSPTTLPDAYYQQNVTLQFVVATTIVNNATPNGTVTITVDGKQQKPQTLPTNLTISLTLTPAVGIHVVSACYSGDVPNINYASSCGTYTFTVHQAVTATTLKVASGQSSAGIPTLTLTANVGVVNNTAPFDNQGTLTFYFNGTALTNANGTITTLANGTATFTTQTQTQFANLTTFGSTTINSYAFTATYSGDSNFAGSTSSGGTQTPGFDVVNAGTSIAIPQGGVATIPLTIYPLYNYTGTITASCSGLPADSICRFSPSSVTFTTAVANNPAQQFNVEIYTNVNPALSSLTPLVPRSSGVMMARMLGWPMLAGLLLWTGRRKRLPARLRLLPVVLLALLLGGVTGSLTGCGSGSSSAPDTGFITPTGTSTVVITYVDANGVKQSQTYSFTVNPPYSLP